MIYNNGIEQKTNNTDMHAQIHTGMQAIYLKKWDQLGFMQVLQMMYGHARAHKHTLIHTTRCTHCSADGMGYSATVLYKTRR